MRLHWQLWLAATSCVSFQRAAAASWACHAWKYAGRLHNSRSESKRFCLELGKLDECDLTVVISATKRYCEVLVTEKMRRERESCFHFKSVSITSTSPTLPAHTSLTRRKKKKQEKKKRKTSRCWCWSSQTLDSGGDGELTWHDGVRDVEVVQGQAQGLTRGGRGRAGGLGGRPGRFDGRGGRRGVAAGLEPIVLGLQRLDLVLLVDKRFKKKKKCLRERASRPRQQGAIPLPGLDSVVIPNQYYWN